MIAVEPPSFWQFLQQVIDVFGHEIRPIHDVPVLADLEQEELSMGSDVGGFIFSGEEDAPGFNHQGSLLDERGEVGSWGNFNGKKLASDTDWAEMEGKKLEYVVGVLKEPFGVEIHKFQQIYDSILKLVFHPD